MKKVLKPRDKIFHFQLRVLLALSTIFAFCIFVLLFFLNIILQ